MLRSIFFKVLTIISKLTEIESNFDDTLVLYNIIFVEAEENQAEKKPRITSENVLRYHAKNETGGIASKYQFILNI